ncbi:MAG TPA: prepilin-type N-terminal cleavage/methylation domain-containing protein [Pyrinomonadaceae bacterium]|nr:prepilin-type N-terminal cleavage/methylation domain-containing protein [Pyrinomonadaceae bacterium]
MRGLNLKLKNSASKGFSLVELMIAMTVVLITLGILSSILAGINYQFKTQRPRLETVNNAQTAADTIVRLIRMAGNRPLNCPAAFLVAAPAPSSPLADGYFGRLHVRADWNPANCSLNDVEEDVTFSVNNGVFYLDAAQQIPFVDKISALRIKLYDQNNLVITDPALTGGTKFVRVEIDTVAQNGFITTVASGASVRK